MEEDGQICAEIIKSGDAMLMTFTSLKFNLSHFLLLIIAESCACVCSGVNYGF